MTEPMTEEQIRVCRQYLEIMELIIDWHASHGNGTSWTLPKYDRRRQEIHFEILKVYGFDTEDETFRATGYIRKGMTPGELHEELMECKKMKGAK